jgi:hypothetical protein
MFVRPAAALAAFCLLGVFAAAKAPPERPSARGVRFTNVRVKQETYAGSDSYTGQVDRIDETKMVVRCWREEGDQTTEIEFYAPDLLAAGKLAKNAGPFAHRWQDVKAGDKIRLHSMFDTDEERAYCFAIQIYRRPGAKLPPFADPKVDADGFAAGSILNDIDNGEDVSDEAIAKAFPAMFDEKSDRTVKQIRPGGLPEKSQKLLEANRKRIAEEKAKKEKELKAAPVTDQSGPKKDDKQ